MDTRNKLQKIIDVLFDAERRYASAAREVQVVKLSRFLNHQNIYRNKYSNELLEVLTFQGIRIEREHPEEAPSDNDELSLNKHSISFRYIPLVSRCLELDQELLTMCSNLLENHTIHIDIAEVLTRLTTHIIFQGIEGNDIVEELRLQQLQRKRMLHLNKIRYMS